MQPTGRTPSIAPVLALAGLLLVVTIALHGHLPGAAPPPRQPAADSPVALVIVVGLLVVSIAVVVATLVARIRAGNPPGPAPRTQWSDNGGRPTWRTWLAAFGLIATWLLVTALLSRLGSGEADPPVPAPDPNPPADADGSRVIDAVPPVRSTGSQLLGYLGAASAIVLVAIVAVGVVVALRRLGRPVLATAGPAEGGPEVMAPDDESESLVRAAEVGLAEVGDLSREPRRAIIACYAAMERELARLPDAAPRDFDTASEVLARAVSYHALRPDSATQLVSLFEEARFSPHVMDEGHRDAAVTLLTQVLAELEHA